MSEELQTSGQNMTLPLWGNVIRYDKMFVSLVEFSAFLEQRAKKSAADFLSIGIHKKNGWLIAGTDYLETEMRRVCNEIGFYITRNNILAVPNWNMFLEPWIALADSSKQLTLSLHDTLIADCTNEVREQANQAYRNSLANSEGLGFGIISSSLTAHFVYAVQAASKEAENKRKAQDVADKVWRNSSPVAKAGELTTKAYHETHEPFVLDTLASFYTNVESFIYTGAGYDKKVVDEQVQQAVAVLGSVDGDLRTKIVQSLSKNICCGEAVLCAIENGQVDDGFIDFCNHAPVMLLNKSIDPIVRWLGKEKRTNLLYNRPVFSEKIRRFLSVVQKVFLSGDTQKYSLYDQILDSAFADEINSTYTAFYDVCHFDDVILKKYANDGTHITISSGTIGLLITLCNEIHSGKLINLVNSAGLILPIEDRQIKILIETANSTIDRCHAELEQARYEAANQEAAAKAEQERIDAEQFSKQQAEKEAQQKETIRKAKIAAIIFTPIVAIALVFALWIWPDIIQPSIEYNSAVTLLEEGKYSDAIAVLETLTYYKNSADLLLEAKYSNGQQLLLEQCYSEAISQFADLGTYKDSQTFILETKYRMAMEELSAGNDAEALELLTDIRPYSNSEQYLSEYQFTLTFMEDYLPDYGVYSEKYNDNGLLISCTTRSGIMYSYEYDKYDRLISINGNDGTTEYIYDTSGNLASEETNDELIEYFYNQDNQLICKRRTKYTYVLGIKCLEVYWITFFEYANGGDLVREYEWLDSEFNPLRISLTEHKYDSDNNCIAEMEYLFDGDIWIHNIENQPYLDDEIKLQLDSMPKELWDEMQYVYADGLLIEEIHVGKSRITYHYENGLLIQKVNHTYDNTYTYYYDDFGNLIREEDTDGGWITYTYTPVFGGDRP